MGIVMRNILLCLMLGTGCSIYYETIVPVRVWRCLLYTSDAADE